MRTEENGHVPLIWASFCRFKNLQHAFKLWLQNSLLQCPFPARDTTTYTRSQRYSGINLLLQVFAHLLLSSLCHNPSLYLHPIQASTQTLLKIYQHSLQHAISILLITQVGRAVSIYSVMNLLHFALLALKSRTAIYSISQQYYRVLYTCACYTVVWYNS